MPVTMKPARVAVTRSNIITTIRTITSVNSRGKRGIGTSWSLPNLLDCHLNF